jgi:hypothetical protein
MRTGAPGHTRWFPVSEGARAVGGREAEMSLATQIGLSALHLPKQSQ